MFLRNEGDILNAFRIAPCRNKKIDVGDLDHPPSPRKRVAENGGGRGCACGGVLDQKCRRPELGAGPAERPPPPTRSRQTCQTQQCGARR